MPLFRVWLSLGENYVCVDKTFQSGTLDPTFYESEVTLTF